MEAVEAVDVVDGSIETGMATATSLGLTVKVEDMISDVA